MDLHKLRVLKFGDHASKCAVSRNDREENMACNPLQKNPKPSGDNKRAKLMSGGERTSRPRKRISNRKKRKSVSDVSLSSQNKLKKHTRKKRTLSLSDEINSAMNNMNRIKHTFDLLSGDPEIHINKKRMHKKKPTRHKIDKDTKILFTYDTPRISSKSRKRSKKCYRKDNPYNLRSSDDIFGFQKSYRALNQLHTNCNYYNTLKKIKASFQCKKKGTVLQPHGNHIRVRVLSTDNLRSIESSLKHYSIVNTHRTNSGPKSVKLHSYNVRNTDYRSKRPTHIDKKLSVAPSSLAKIGKCFCNSRVGTTKSFTQLSRSKGTRCHYLGTQIRQNGMPRLSHEASRLSHERHCRLRGFHSLHEKSQTSTCYVCIRTQFPSGTNVDAAKCESNKINQTDEHMCRKRTCLNNQYTRLYARNLQKTKPRNAAINLVKYASLGLFIIMLCPCIFAIGLAWIITYPLKLQHVTTVDKAKQPSNGSCLFSKFRKKHHENKRIHNMDCLEPKKKSFLSCLSNWSTRAANNIVKSINTLESVFKINENNPGSKSSFRVTKHPNFGNKYSLFNEVNTCCVMKPVRSQKLPSLHHAEQGVKNICHGSRFNANRQKLAGSKRHEEQQGTSLLRSPSVINTRTMPTSWQKKSVYTQSFPCNEVIILPKKPNLNHRHTRSSIYKTKKTLNQITDKSQICINETKSPAGRNSLFGINASRCPPEMTSKNSPNKKTYGVHKNIQSFINKWIISSQSILSQNVAMSRQNPAYGIACNHVPQCSMHCNSHRFPNHHTKLLPTKRNRTAHQSGVKLLYKSKNNEHNFPSKSGSPYSMNSISVDKSNTRLLKHGPNLQSKISINVLSSRHASSYRFFLNKLLCTVDKLYTYLEQTGLKDCCLNKQNKCSGNNDVISPNKASLFSCNPNHIPFFPEKIVEVVQEKQHAEPSHIKCICVDKKNNHINNIHVQHSPLPADYKSSHCSCKTATPKHLSCTCLDDGPKGLLESPAPSYSSKTLSLPLQTSEVTKRLARNVVRYLQKTINKIHMKKKYSGSGNICSSFDHSIKHHSVCPEDSLYQQKEHQIRKSQILHDGAGCKCHIAVSRRNKSHNPQTHETLQEGVPEKTKRNYALRKKLKFSHHVRSNGKNKIISNSALCQCLDKNTRSHRDELASTHDHAKRNSDCQCPSEITKLLPQQTLTDKIENSQNKIVKVSSENVKSKVKICECAVRSQSSKKLSQDNELVRGTKVKCTCSDKHSTSQHHPFNGVPLRSGKSDKVRPKSMVTREVMKSFQQSNPSKCACMCEKPKHSKKSDHKVYLKRSFKKLHFDLPLNVSSHVKCTCSSDKALLDNDCKCAMKTSRNPQKLSETSIDNIQKSNSGENIIRFLQKIVGAIRSKLSSHTPSQVKCSCLGEKINRTSGKESQHSVKSSNGSSQRVKFESVKPIKPQPVSRQPKPGNSNKCACANGRTKLPPDTQPFPLPSSNKTKFLKEKITFFLRNTVYKLHSMLARNICKCPDKDTNKPLKEKLSSKCYCSKEVKHRIVKAPSHTMHRTRTTSSQWLQSPKDLSRLRSQHPLNSQVVYMCDQTCISKRPRPSPQGIRFDYPTLIPDPHHRRHAVSKRMLSPESNRKSKPKRRSFGKIFCKYCRNFKDTIVYADEAVWPKKNQCDGKLYIHTLRKKPCYWVLKYCPCMYPCVFTIYSLTKNMCTTFLYFVSLICWCPFYCCMCLVCEDICCCLRRC